jgi:hypothetical protein
MYIIIAIMRPSVADIHPLCYYCLHTGQPQHIDQCQRHLYIQARIISWQTSCPYNAVLRIHGIRIGVDPDPDLDSRIHVSD